MLKRKSSYFVARAGLALLAMLVAMVAAAAQDSAVMMDTAFSVSTDVVSGPPETGFDSGLVSAGRIQAKYAAAPGAPAATLSFPFTWSNLPEGTAALALVLDDPDARLVLKSYGMDQPSFLHWIATDIDPSSGMLAEGASGKMLFTEGKNGAGAIGYMGPQPPNDIPKDAMKPLIHVYRLTLYALSAKTGLAPGFSLSELMAAINGKVLAKAQFLMSYVNP